MVDQMYRDLECNGVTVGLSLSFFGVFIQRMMSTQLKICDNPTRVKLTNDPSAIYVSDPLEVTLR